MPWVKTETLRHKAAFEYYYSLGDKRSHKLVMREYKVSGKTVAAWAKSFGWLERIQVRDAELGQHLERRTNESVLAVKADYRRMIRGNLARWWTAQFQPEKGLKEGATLVVTAADLERLIKLDLLLMGEATERQEVDVDWREKLLGRLARLAARAGETSGDDEPESSGGPGPIP